MIKETTIVLCARSVCEIVPDNKNRKQYLRLTVAKRNQDNSNLERYENLPCQNLAVDLSQQPLGSGSAIIQ